MEHVWRLEGEIRKNGGLALRAVAEIDGREVKTLKYTTRTTGKAEIARITEDVLKQAQSLEVKRK